MHLFSARILLISVLITLCYSQSYSGYSYPAQRRAAYLNQPYYNRQNSYYPSTTSNRNSNSNLYYQQQQTPQRNYKQQTSSSSSSSYYPSTSSKGYSSSYNQPLASSSPATSSYSPQQSSSTNSRGYYSSSNTVNNNGATAVSSSGSYSSGSRGTSQQQSSSTNSRGYYSPSNTVNNNAVTAVSSSTASRRYYNPYNQQSNSVYRNAGQTYSSPASSTVSRGSSNSASDPISTKQYLTNSYSTDNSNYKDTSASNSNKLLQDDSIGKFRVSKADMENAKFAGADNQEDEDEARTALLKRKKLRRRFSTSLASPCYPFGRDAGNADTSTPKEQGRFLWDVNVVNVYPQTPVASPLGCGGGLGGLGGGLAGLGGLGGIGGGGLLSDPIAQPYYPPGTGIANFLSLFAPGILQNSLAVTARPQLYSDSLQNQNQNNDNFQNNDLQSDPDVDPNYRPQQIAQPIRRPNRVYYDSMGAPPVTPGQLLGGVATTVNGIIQQLTGNVQPVYG